MQLGDAYSKPTADARAAVYTATNTSFSSPSAAAALEPVSEIQRQCHYEAARMLKKNNLSTAHINSHSSQVTSHHNSSPMKMIVF